MNKREEEKLKKQQERLEKEIARTKAMSTFEEEYKDYPYICGIDEVGRGPLAGPVVAGAVILPKDDMILYLNAVTIPQVDILQVPIIKGDAKSISIAAASIIAKVTRDRLMVEYDKVLPGYDFESNKGYGTKAHIAGLKELGPTPIHRRSFIHNYV